MKNKIKVYNKKIVNNYKNKKKFKKMQMKNLKKLKI